MEDSDGSLLALGLLTLTDQPGIWQGAARWTGVTWEPLGSGQPNSGYIEAIRLSNGTLLKGGSGLSRWDGSNFVSIAPASVHPPSILALAELPDGRAVVAGVIDSRLGAVAFNNIAVVDGAAWSPLGQGLDGWVRDVAVAPDGSVLAAGGHRNSIGAWAGRIARWHNGTWTELLSDDTNYDVHELVVLPDGGLVVGGQFTRINGLAALRVAHFNGSTWSPLGTGIGPAELGLGVIETLTPLVNGDLFAGGLLTSERCYSRFTSPCLCPADLDNDGDLSNGPTRDDAVDVNDLLYFLGAFELGDQGADLDDDGDPAQGHPDQAVTIDDLLFFLARFEQGC